MAQIKFEIKKFNREAAKRIQTNTSPVSKEYKDI